MRLVMVGGVVQGLVKSAFLLITVLLIGCSPIHASSIEVELTNKPFKGRTDAIKADEALHAALICRYATRFEKHECSLIAAKEACARGICNNPNTFANAMMRVLGKPFEVAYLPEEKISCFGTCGAMIGLIDQNLTIGNPAYVLIEKATKESVIWFDPKNGLYQTDKDTFIDHWRPHGFVAIVEKECMLSCI